MASTQALVPPTHLQVDIQPVQSPEAAASVLSEQSLALQVYPVPLYEHVPRVEVVNALQIVYLLARRVTVESKT